VALVYAPARSGRPSAAALVYAVAGWGGSALGIGMAQDLHAVPDWFAIAAAAVVVAGLMWRWCSHGRLSRMAVVLMATLSAGVVFTAQPARAEDAALVIERGREVYIAEGCIHCHSQYVRPGTEDVVRWGPVRPLEELLRDKPPLFGNRRQGPDLLNVGNRRSEEWNRLHLIAPREVSPGSRMPSYARLFAPGERRGDELVAYLASLGAETREWRAKQAAAWRPDAEVKVDARAGATWFHRVCAQCHGDTGRGDGPLAGRLPARPADLTKSAMTDELELARIIKFGRPGTAMAGHESLDDAAVVSLASHVRSLQGSEQTTR
jgi:mono/diheme cytochrome c family protein